MYTAISSKKGFTLVELIVVLSIVAILVAVVAIVLTVFISKGEETGCEADADALRIAALSYYHDNSEWPQEYSDLITLGYIDREAESDDDCDWGVSTDTANKTEGFICHYATAAGAAADNCKCEDTTKLCNFAAVNDLKEPP